MLDPAPADRILEIEYTAGDRVSNERASHPHRLHRYRGERCQYRHPARRAQHRTLRIGVGATRERVGPSREFRWAPFSAASAHGLRYDGCATSRLGSEAPVTLDSRSRTTDT